MSDQTPAPQTKALKPVDEVRRGIAMMEPQFKMALPPHIAVEKFMRIVNTAIGSTPAILKCDRQSLFQSALRAAQDGLLPDGREAALVSFGDKVTYMPMVAGLLKKIRNSGELSSITAQAVYEKDDFQYYVDSDGEHINHRPNMFSDRGQKLGVYALAKTKDGGIYIEVLTMKQVNDIKNVSRAKGSGPWSGPFAEEMEKKSAIRRLSKRLPMSTDLESTLHADDDLFMPAEETETATPEPKPKKKSRLAEKLEEQAKEAATIDVESAPTPEPTEPPPLNQNQEIPI